MFAEANGPKVDLSERLGTVSDDSRAPAVTVWRSEEDTHWTAQIDTTQRTGPVPVDLNDGRLFYGDAEEFDAVVAAEGVIHASGEGVLSPGTVQAVVDASEETCDESAAGLGRRTLIST